MLLNKYLDSGLNDMKCRNVGIEYKQTYLVVESGIDTPMTSICPLMGRPNVRPETPRKTPVSTCLKLTVSSLGHASPEQITFHTSPVSPSPNKEIYYFMIY